MNSNLRRFFTVAALAILVVPAATGCVWGMFNKIKLDDANSVSCGRELIDLQEAKAKGAISEAEFLAMKGKIIKNDNETVFSIH